MLVISCAALCIAVLAHSEGARAPVLSLERTIPMPNVEGRIDHLSLDVNNERLFVAALGNDTVEIIDLKKGERAATIEGLHEPQGVLYLPAMNRLYVANGKDGTLVILNATTLQPIRSIPLGDDADNVRLDPANGHIFVGYGSGALAETDFEGKRLGDTKLDAHPESFQLERNGSRIFVNLPGSRKVAVIDRKTRSVLTTWGTGLSLANYPMALDEANHRLFVGCRVPARLIVFDTGKGERVATLHTVGDTDDIFFDSKRKRIYIIGGDGSVAVVAQQSANEYKELGRIATGPGARTGLFSPDLDRLFVAERKHGSNTAAIQVFAPGP